MPLSCRVRLYSKDIVTEEKISVLIRRNKSGTTRLLFLIKCCFPCGFGCEHCNIVILHGRLHRGTTAHNGRRVFRSRIFVRQRRRVSSSFADDVFPESYINQVVSYGNFSPAAAKTWC